MTDDLTHDSILDAAEKWINSADAMDQALFGFVLLAWVNKNGSPPNSASTAIGTVVNVAVFIRALPGVISTTKRVRALIPHAEVRRFLRAKRREAFVGDLQERSQRIQKQSGTEAAMRWYRSEVLRSFGPLVWNALMQVSGLETLVEFCRGDRS